MRGERITETLGARGAHPVVTLGLDPRMTTVVRQTWEMTGPVMGAHG